MRDVEKERELLEEKINRMVQDVASYLQLIEVKDESIVKLSNKLDELELAVKMDKAGSPPILGRKLWRMVGANRTLQPMEVVTSTSATWRRFLSGPRPRRTRPWSSWKTR